MSKIEMLQIDAVAREKNIDKSVVLQAVEEAIQKAGRSKYGYEHDIRCHIDPRTGDVELKRYRTVTETEAIENEAAQITLEQAKREKGDAAVGDILIDTLPAFDYGRVAAQTAKQVIMQNIREAEREIQFNDYKDRVGEIISGVIKRVEYGNATIDLGRAEAVLLRLGNGALHRVHGGDLAHGAVRVEHDGERRFMHDLRHGVRADHAAFHTAVVADQTLHAVGFQSLQIGGEQNVGNIAALFFVESVFAHNGFAVSAKLLFRQTIVRHMSLSFLYRTGSNLFDRLYHLYHILTKEKSLFRRKKTAHGILQKDIGKSPGRTYNYGRTLSGRNGQWINTRC